MDDHLSQNDVFKFVAIRPPATIDSDTEEKRFIKDKRNPEDSIVLKEIDQLLAEGVGEDKYFSKIRSLITEHGYSPDFSLEKNQMFLDIDKLIKQSQKKNNEPQLIKGIDYILGVVPSEYIKTNEYNQILNHVWDSLYAFHIINRVEPVNLENLIQDLRILYIIEYFSKESPIKNSMELNDICEAIPVLPKQVFTIPNNPESKSKYPITDIHKSEEMYYIKQLQDFIRLYKAHEEIKAIPDYFNDSFKIHDANVREDNDWIGGHIKRWLLNGDVVKSLSDDTKSVLKNSNLNIENDGFPEILKRLEEHLRIKSNNLVDAPNYDILKELPEEVESIPGLKSYLHWIIGKSSNPITSKNLSSSLDLNFPHSDIIRPLSPLDPIFSNSGIIRPLGIGDLKVVKQTLVKYAKGEVAHIENVLLGEHKDRKHRRLDRTEEIFMTEKETTEAEEKDNQSTERFELKQETEKNIQSDESKQAGITVSGGYGPVQITAQGNYATSTSISESKRASMSFAKDVIDRSVSKVQKRSLERRTRKTLQEIEEINEHGFDNRKGKGHISGIYRWVDKHYKAQVYNYGSRLMMEFIVPEPAAFYLHSKKYKPLTGMPEKPKNLDITHKDLTSWNYQQYIKEYRVQGVSPPPATFTVVSTALDKPSAEKKQENFAKSYKEIQVPSGYRARWNYVLFNSIGEDDSWATLNVGMSLYDLARKNNNLGKALCQGMWHQPTEFQRIYLDGLIPVSILTRYIDAFALNIEILCDVTEESYEEWQLKTYDAILAAYHTMKQDYERALASQTLGVVISGNNPEMNRVIEKEELKKWCLNLFTRQSFNAFNAMIYPSNTTNKGLYPEINLDMATSQGKYIQFFEQAFEWENMTYLFYPYFWGKKDDWVDKLNIQDADPLFTKFLQAGSARVIVPVPLAYRQAVLYYLETSRPDRPGDIWNGGDAPVLDDPLYISIVNELRSQQDPYKDAIPEGEPWDVIIPTTLVYLQEDSELPDSTKNGYRYLKIEGYGASEEGQESTTRIIEVEAYVGKDNILRTTDHTVIGETPSKGSINLETIYDGVKTASSDSYPIWWTATPNGNVVFDFHTPRALTKLAYYGYSIPGVQRAYRFRFLGSNDNVNWTVLWDMSTNTTPQPILPKGYVKVL
ncbi:hypothetical protein AYK81_00470 [Bacillus thuringiensis]|nr:hypothetical protein AYK81_00470 [Bacillus thuringiensis]